MMITAWGSIARPAALARYRHRVGIRPLPVIADKMKDCNEKCQYRGRDLNGQADLFRSGQSQWSTPWSNFTKAANAANNEAERPVIDIARTIHDSYFVMNSEIRALQWRSCITSSYMEPARRGLTGYFTSGTCTGTVDASIPANSFSITLPL